MSAFKKTEVKHSLTVRGETIFDLYDFIAWSFFYEDTNGDDGGNEDDNDEEDGDLWMEDCRLVVSAGFAVEALGRPDQGKLAKHDHRDGDTEDDDLIILLER